MNNIKKGKCPICGKDGAEILTINNGDETMQEVMCRNRCGHFVLLKSNKNEENQ